ncbi:MAG: hypothetical protein NWF05_08975 [Candidatus Bathyarchaeota archaeon]|nr:hypothetical protein [Candidatus Bathyarchaeota archaeon]
MREFDWCYRLYVDRKLYLGLLNLQAEKSLTKSKAGLLSIVEGLHSLGYLSDGDYEVYRAKYSVSLEETANAPTEADIIRQERAHNKNRQLNRHFEEVLAQWSQLKDSAKQYHIKEAEKHKNLKTARLLLDLANNPTLETLEDQTAVR